MVWVNFTAKRCMRSSLRSLPFRDAQIPLLKHRVKAVAFYPDIDDGPVKARSDHRRLPLFASILLGGRRSSIAPDPYPIPNFDVVVSHYITSFHYKLPKVPLVVPPTNNSLQDSSPRSASIPLALTARRRSEPATNADAQRQAPLGFPVLRPPPVISSRRLPPLLRTAVGLLPGLEGSAKAA